MRSILILSVLLAVTPIANAQPPAAFQTPAEEAMVMDFETGATLYEKDADKTFAPASMSKIMTLELLFKKLKAAEITLDTEFPVSQYAWRTGGGPARTTSMLIPLNTTAKVGDLIQGIAVQNGNDACIAVAEGLSGTEESFAEAMTDEARALGLQKSRFANSTGFPNPGNVTTARDLAMLAAYVIKTYPEYYAYFAQKEFKYRTHNFKNLNPLLASALGVDGLKLGATEGAGFGAVASAAKDGRRVIAVMNGFKTDKDRREEVIKTIGWGFANFKAFKVYDSGDIVGEARVWGAENSHVALKTLSEVKILLPVNAKDRRLKGKITYMGPLKPPVADGDRVGEIKIVSDSTGTSNTAPLYAAASVQPAGMLRKGLDSLVLGVDEIVSASLAKIVKRQGSAAAAAPAP